MTDRQTERESERKKNLTNYKTFGRLFVCCELDKIYDHILVDKWIFIVTDTRRIISVNGLEREMYIRLYWTRV